MPEVEVHDRAYLRSRLAEEMHRSGRYGHPFALLVFEAVPSPVDGMPIRQKVAHALHALAETVRVSDVVAAIHEDVLAVLLVEATPEDAKDALFRFRSRVTREAGTWHTTTYCFPSQAELFGSIQFLRAA